jgi:hypothetical protein
LWRGGISTSQNKVKVLYHITTAERAKNILRTGFNDNLVSNYGSPYPKRTTIRVFLCPEKFIPRWTKILGSELKWPKVAVLQVSLPLAKFKELCKRGSKMTTVKHNGQIVSFSGQPMMVNAAKEPFIWDEGDQIILQFKKRNPVEIKLKLL